MKRLNRIIVSIKEKALPNIVQSVTKTSFLHTFLMCCMMMSFLPTAVLVRSDALRQSESTPPEESQTIPAISTAELLNHTTEPERVHNRLWYQQQRSRVSLQDAVYLNSEDSDIRIALLNGMTYAIPDDQTGWIVIDDEEPEQNEISKTELTENEAAIYQFLTNTLGLNTAATCGVLANMYWESKFNPTIQVIDTNGLASFGICQWNGGRFDALREYCFEHEYDYRTIPGQLQFLKYELDSYENSTYRDMKKTEDTKEGAFIAGYLWARGFERCSSRFFEMRAKTAYHTYWPKYTGMSQEEIQALLNADYSFASYLLPNMSYLDVNVFLDGAHHGVLGDCGTVDVYINGALIADNVTDYYAAWPSGTEYEIRDIRPNNGYSYEGLHIGTRRGTIGDANVEVSLTFSTVNANAISEPAAKAIYGGHTYLYYDAPVTWYTARQLCKTLGGYLVTITEANENQFVRSLCGENPVWTGATDAREEGTWQWITDEAFSYKNWMSGEPNNASSDEEDGEDYLCLSQNGQWIDNKGCMTRPFVCELDTAEPELVSIMIQTPPERVNYSIGDELDTSGLEVGAVYSDDSVKTLTSGFQIDGFNPAQSGTQTISVTYAEKTTEFTVTVTEPEPDSEPTSPSQTEQEPETSSAPTPSAEPETESISSLAAPELPNIIPCVIAEKKDAVSGERVTIPIILKDYEAIASFRVDISYDQTALELLDISKKEFDTVSFSSNENIIHLQWQRTEWTAATERGILAELTFQIHDGAVGPVSISITPIDCNRIDGTSSSLDVINGEITVTPQSYTITYDANGGTGTMTETTVTSGTSLILPKNDFTPPDGKQFKAWSVNGIEYAPGTELSIHAPTTILAIWES